MIPKGNSSRVFTVGRSSILSIIVFVVSVVLAACLTPKREVNAGATRKVVMISIDGLRPDFYLSSLFTSPTLRALKDNGIYSTGVISVFPSVTYPNHVSLVTGVKPAQHGIISNSIFNWNDGPTPAWYWEASKIKVPTILQLAQQNGLTTASVRWPVSLGGDATYLIPEIFGMTGYYEGDDWDLTVKYTKPELMNQVLATTTLKGWKNESEMDKWVAEASAFLLRKYHPSLTTIHLANVDHVMHGTGRSSPETVAAVQEVDLNVKTIVDAVDANTCVLIVGDHGFYDFTKRISPNVLFMQKGWLTVQKGTIVDWKVVAHSSGGQAGIYTKDKTLIPQIHDLLKANEGLGYNLVERDQLDRYGAYPEAVFAISGKDGYTVSGSVSGPAFQDLGKVAGQHGYLPEDPQIHTGFIASGCGIQPGKNLGVMSLLDVAPTAAKLLGLQVPQAQGKALTLVP